MGLAQGDSSFVAKVFPIPAATLNKRGQFAGSNKLLPILKTGFLHWFQQQLTRCKSPQMGAHFRRTSVELCVKKVNPNLNNHLGLKVELTHVKTI